jgi:signal transduction histidine kinase
MYDSQKPHRVNSGKITVQFEDQRTEGFLSLGLLGRSIVQLLPMGVVVFDSDLRVVESNSTAANLIELGDYIDKSLAKGTDNPEKAGLEWSEKLKSALAAGQMRRFEGVNYVYNGGSRLLRIIFTPIIEPKAQKALAGSILIEDTTEKADIQMKLAKAERLAAIGRHASKIAHELNSPLDGVLRYINLAARIVEQADLTKPKEYLDRSRQALLRMVQILSELLEFSRGNHAQLEYSNIEQIIEDALRTADAKTEKLNIQIFRYYMHDIPKIRNGSLFQVFCNIVKNAYDAMPEGGQLHISTRLEPDNTIVAEFRDTGKGFAPENKEAMFEPFFTTKEKGTGLGLAICKDIVERYHGQITAENSQQGGSIFTVYLPLASIS